VLPSRLPSTTWAVKLRLILVVQGDVSRHGEKLDLLVDGDLPVFLAFDLEEAQRGLAEGADSGQMGGGDLVLSREARETLDHLFFRIENEEIRRLAGVGVQYL
jgi:hypothetical protein